MLSIYLNTKHSLCLLLDGYIMLFFGLPVGALPVKLDTGETQTLTGSSRSDRFGILCLINQGDNDKSAGCCYTACAGSEGVNKPGLGSHRKPRSSLF